VFHDCFFGVVFLGRRGFILESQHRGVEVPAAYLRPVPGSSITGREFRIDDITHEAPVFGDGHAAELVYPFPLKGHTLPVSEIQLEKLKTINTIEFQIRLL
jgi:hypothetical protein